MTPAQLADAIERSNFGIGLSKEELGLVVQALRAFARPEEQRNEVKVQCTGGDTTTYRCMFLEVPADFPIVAPKWYWIRSAEESHEPQNGQR